MSKYLTRSASVLSEADRFEIQMNWMLFTQEQDARIWAPRVEGEWYPGDFLYHVPYDDLDPVTGEYEVTGNVPREMIQVFRDGNPSIRPRCNDCQVSWGYVGKVPAIRIPCWNCGAYSKPLGPEKPSIFDMAVVRTRQDVMDDVSDEDVEYWVRREMAMAMDDAFDGLRESANRLTENWRRFSEGFVEGLRSGFLSANDVRVSLDLEPIRMQPMQNYAQADIDATMQMFTEIRQENFAISNERPPLPNRDRTYPGSEPITEQRRRRR